MRNRWSRSEGSEAMSKPRKVVIPKKWWEVNFPEEKICDIYTEYELETQMIFDNVLTDYDHKLLAAFRISR